MPDPLAMIKEDHEKVKALFANFEDVREDDSEEKLKLSNQIFDELEKHMDMEEQVFYPALENAGQNSMASEADNNYDEALAQVSETRNELKDAYQNAEGSARERWRNIDSELARLEEQLSNRDANSINTMSEITQRLRQ